MATPTWDFPSQHIPRVGFIPVPASAKALVEHIVLSIALDDSGGPDGAFIERPGITTREDGIP
jgi:hypothetical protein